MSTHAAHDSAGDREQVRLKSGPSAVEEPSRIRVVIADPDPLARRVIRDMLQEHDANAYTVPAEASNGTEAIELASYYRPDVVTLESEMGDMSGVEAIRRILARAPEVKPLVFSCEASADIQLESVAAGASGYVEKAAGVAGLASAIEAIVTGDAVIPQRTVMRLVERLRTVREGGIGMRPVHSPLTQREWEILDLMSQGFDTHEMAEQLVLSAETIYSHVKRILNKLGVHSRQDAVAVAKTMRDPFAIPTGEPAESRRDGSTSRSAHRERGSARERGRLDPRT